MALAGEPLKRRHGVLLYSPQPTKDTPVTPATAVGIASPRATSDSGMNNVFGIGSQTILFMKPGLAQVPISITIDHLQDKTFLQRAQLVSGGVPYSTIAIGYMDDAGTKFAWQIDNFKIASVDLACEAGGPVTATFTGVGELITELTTLSPIQITDDPFKWYEAIVTRGAAPFECASFRATINNNITPLPCLNGAVPSPASRKRMNRYYPEGYLDVTGEFVRYAKSGVSLQGDTIAASNLAVNFQDAVVPAHTLNLAFTTSKFLSEEFNIGDDIRFTLPWRASSWSVT